MISLAFEICFFLSLPVVSFVLSATPQTGGNGQGRSLPVQSIHAGKTNKWGMK